MGNPVNKLKTLDVINPATEDVIGTIAMGDSDDVDAAVKAAKMLWNIWTNYYRREIEILQKIVEIYMTRSAEIAEMISIENGSPITLSEMHKRHQV